MKKQEWEETRRALRSAKQVQAMLEDEAAQREALARRVAALEAVLDGAAEAVEAQRRIDAQFENLLDFNGRPQSGNDALFGAPKASPYNTLL